MTTILIIEDNDDLAFGLRRFLEAEGFAVQVAADGASGARLAAALHPDLVLLDIMLPGEVDGFRTLSLIRQAKGEMPVLIMTARGDETDKVHGFVLGADDYLVKPFGLSEMLARVRALLRRSRPREESPEVLRFADVEVNPGARVVTKRGERVALTPREFELLLALLRRPGTALSRVALLRLVWEHQADVLTRTVDIHVGELRRKLEDVPAEPRHIVTVWKTGYRFDP